MVRTGQLVMAWIKIPGHGGKMIVRAGKRTVRTERTIHFI
jgi:hypothetical protein